MKTKFKILSRKIPSICFILLTFTISGCYELKIKYTINPDKSGKAQISLTAPLDVILGSDIQAAMAGSDDRSDLTESLKRAARKLISSTAGVDVWTNLSYRWLENGEFHFQGTAYFKNYSYFSFCRDSKRPVVGILPPTLTLKKEHLELRKLAKATKRKSFSLSREALLKEKVKSQNDKFILNAILKGWKSRYEFELPGELKKVQGFSRDKNNIVSFEILGDKILSKLDSNTATKHLLETPSDILISRKSFDAFISRESMLAVASKPFKQLFDYDKETKSAAKYWRKKREEIFHDSTEMGIDTKIVNLKGSPIREVNSPSIQFAGFQWNKKSKWKKASDLLYFTKKGMSMTLLLKLPLEATAITQATLTDFLLKNGTDILANEKCDRRIHSPKLSKNGMFVKLLIEFPFADEIKTGIAKLKGKLKYEYCSGMKSVDLGVIPLREGSKATKLGARISDMDKDLSDPSAPEYTFDIHVAIAQSHVLGFDFYDGNRKKLEFEHSGTMTSNGEVSYSFSSAKPLPNQLGIKVRLYAKAQINDVTFELADIDVFGEQLLKK